MISIRKLLEHFNIPFYSNAYYLMIGSGAGAIFGFVFWIIAARLYEPADVGSAAAAISATALLATVSMLGLGFGMIRFLPTRGVKASSTINSCLSIAGLTSLVVASIFLVGLEIWSPALLFIRQHPIFVASFILFTIAWTLFSLLDTVFIASRNTKPVFIKIAINGLLKVAILIPLAAFFNVFSIFGSVMIAALITILVTLFWLLPSVQDGYKPLPIIKKKLVGDLINYSLSNYVANLLLFAPGMIFPLIVVNILGAETNAYFFIAWTVANLLLLIPIAVSASLFAEGSYDESMLLLNARRALKLVLLFLLPIILLIFGIGDKLLLLFGEVYSESGTRLLWILALAVIPYSVNLLYLVIKRVTMDMRRVILVSAGIFCLAIGLGYFLTGAMGLLGIGVGWLGANSAVAIVIILLFFGRRRSMT